MLSQEQILSRALQEPLLGVVNCMLPVMEWKAGERAHVLNSQCLAGRKQKSWEDKDPVQTS